MAAIPTRLKGGGGVTNGKKQKRGLSVEGGGGERACMYVCVRERRGKKRNSLVAGQRRDPQGGRTKVARMSALAVELRWAVGPGSSKSNGPLFS